MSWRNFDDVLRQLRDAGLIVEGSDLRVSTTNPARCRVEGDRERRGWYRLYELPTAEGDSLIVGSFGVWRGNENNAQKIVLPREARKALTADQRAALRDRMRADKARDEARLKARHARAAERASRWWAQCQDVGAAAYLTRKGLPPGRLYGARISTEGGNLVIPMQDDKGATWGLQVIYNDPAIKARKGRDKDYAPPGLSKKGRYFLIGSPVAGCVLLITEGFATACTLHEATGLPVAVAFDAGNLVPVAQILRKRYRGARILVCADDDYLTTPNTGCMAAETAALAVSGAWVCPRFPVERSQDKARKGPTDFNDLHTLPQGGLSEVRAQIEAALAACGWVPALSAPEPAIPAQAAAGGGDQGAGEGGGLYFTRPDSVSVMTLQGIAERFLFVDEETGEYVFDTWTRTLCKRSKVTALMPPRTRFDDLKDHPLWRSRSVHLTQIGFDPTGTDKNVRANLFTGMERTPKAGCCDLLLEMLRYYVGNEPEANRDALVHWLTCWLAYPLQHPGAKMQTALVIHGPQGVGKGRFFEAMVAIYGRYGVFLNQGAIEDKFNADWCSQKLFVVADEIVARQDLYHLKNQLKAFITNPTVRVNPKNVTARDEKNQMNIVFLSNEVQPVQLEDDDRRHMVLWTPPPLSAQFYDELSQEIDGGGIDALYHYLLNYPLAGFKEHTRPLKTTAKEDLINIGASSEQRFIADWVSGEELPYPVGPCAPTDLYRAYRHYCTANGIARPRDSRQFLGYIKKLSGWATGKARLYESAAATAATAIRRVIIPPGIECPDGELRARWLSDACAKFAEALAATNSPSWAPGGQS